MDSALPFKEKLANAASSNRSLLCVGLDPDPAITPLNKMLPFLKGVVDATQEEVCAYKPNLAFYEAYGVAGWEALVQLREYIPPQIPVIADAKRGDVTNTAAAYALALFQVWGFDAATVNPYAGGDSVAPFLEYRDKGVLLFCHSSNPGAGDFQDLELRREGEVYPLYQWVAIRAREWDRHGNVGLVVGATYPEELAQVRQLCPQMPILVPGVGPQGGALEASVRAGVDKAGRGLIVNASRQVFYASSGGGNFAQAAREAARGLREKINRELERMGLGW